MLLLLNILCHLNIYYFKNIYNKFVNVVIRFLDTWQFSKWENVRYWNEKKIEARALAKLAASHVFRSIPIRSPILSSIRIRNEKEPPR
jgi:hypothetical protein